MTNNHVTNTHPQVTAIKAFNDNYIWALASKINDNIALIDPGDASICIDYLQKNNLVLSAILVTHHHNDHVGGIKSLLDYAQEKLWPVTVYGPANENIAQLDVKLKENDTVNLTNLSYKFSVLDLPGHTKGHIAYHNEEMLFCGDTLFSAGCGRLFEGTPKQMHHSIAKLANLSDNTLVYCAHEYTQANLTFALAVEPSNRNLHNYAKQVDFLRQNEQATIPSTIGLERKINPFMRCNEDTIKLAAQEYSKTVQMSECDVFSVIRGWKNNF
jgi:hydroxyacylglutathione hydrolase